MKTVTDIRHENLTYLLNNDVSSIQEMSEKVGKSHSYVSQLKIKAKNIGDKIAREFEVAFDKPHGWMDADHTKDSDLPPPPSDKDYVLIPEYEIRAECGSGDFCEHVTLRGDFFRL